MSEGTRAQGPQGGRSGEEGIEEHSSSDTNTTTVENFKGPKGLLAQYDVAMGTGMGENGRRRRVEDTWSITSRHR